MTDYPIYRHIKTGAQFKCILAAVAIVNGNFETFEWFAFEKVVCSDGRKNQFFGFVMNNVDSIDEFGEWNLSELPKNAFFSATPKNLQTIIPPHGFTRVV